MTRSLSLVSSERRLWRHHRYRRRSLQRRKQFRIGRQDLGLRCNHKRLSQRLNRLQLLRLSLQLRFNSRRKFIIKLLKVTKPSQVPLIHSCKRESSSKKTLMFSSAPRLLSLLLLRDGKFQARLRWRSLSKQHSTVSTRLPKRQ